MRRKTGDFSAKKHFLPSACRPSKDRSVRSEKIPANALLLVFSAMVSGSV